jgi:cystathionine beta-synthase
MKFKSLTESIGNTPLIQINVGLRATILAKLEYLNPAGSVKDRSALFMIEEAERTGKLKPGGIIIDASSGNQGIATAMIGAMKGYKVIITVSEKISQEKLNMIKAYGAEVIVCPATDFLEHPESYHSHAKQLHQETPNSFMPNQYFNTSNANGHYYSLGPEIWQQTEGTITHLFAAAGTGGHSSGIGRYLKEQNPAINVIALDSINSWYSTKGNPKPYKVDGMGIDFDSPVLDKKVIDEIIAVSDEDALAMLKILATRYGLLVGPTSGAVMHATLEYAKNLDHNAVCVMVFGDSGRAYLTKNFYTYETDQRKSSRIAPKNIEKIAL